MTAPDPETVEALAKWQFEQVRAHRLAWEEVFSGVQDMWRAGAAGLLASPAMRTLLADTARAAEARVIEDGWCRACDRMIPPAALRASEADR